MRLLSSVAVLYLVLTACSRKPLRFPYPTAPGVTVSHFLAIGPDAVRIDQDPVTQQLVYTTFGGFVYEVCRNFLGRPFTRVRFTPGDHGITELQGMAFLGDTLFLVGNRRVNGGKGTRGIGMRAIRTGPERYDWIPFFLTEEMGGNKTIFNHGFNAVTTDPQGRYLYISSGARTDHGELQDNDGLYPGQRDVPLTACVLRIPTDAIALTLRNDREWLRSEGFLFAEGIRNAYDMAFSPDHKLFAVVNSGDYDHPEDMFEILPGKHYGFPWVMGGLNNPQQFPDWHPDAATDPFMPATSHAYVKGYFHNDPLFPVRPAGLDIPLPVQNRGPRLNHYRDAKTGRVMDADSTGLLVGTFTPHACPLGLFFDTRGALDGVYHRGGFMLTWTDGENFELMSRISPEGEELLHLDLTWENDQWLLTTRRLVDNFLSPTDAVQVGSDIYVIEYGNRANIWRVRLPSRKQG